MPRGMEVTEEVRPSYPKAKKRKPGLRDIIRFHLSPDEGHPLGAYLAISSGVIIFLFSCLISPEWGGIGWILFLCVFLPLGVWLSERYHKRKRRRRSDKDD